jgi:hypothetical protein
MIVNSKKAELAWAGLRWVLDKARKGRSQGWSGAEWVELAQS